MLRAIGLKEDGTCVVAEKALSEWVNVDDWTDIVKIAGSDHAIIGLKADGTCVAAGRTEYFDLDVSDWKNIVRVDAGGINVAGVTEDGIYQTGGRDSYGKLDFTVANYENQDMVDVCIDMFGMMVLKSNGTIWYNTKGRIHLPEFYDLRGIAGSDENVFGVKADGTVVSTSLTVNQIASAWTDIIAINAKRNDVIAIQADGTVLTTYPEVSEYEFPLWNVFPER